VGCYDIIIPVILGYTEGVSDLTLKKPSAVSNI
jgi:hypothetical protein